MSDFDRESPFLTALKQQGAKTLLAQVLELAKEKYGMTNTQTARWRARIPRDYESTMGPWTLSARNAMSSEGFEVTSILAQWGRGHPALDHVVVCDYFGPRETEALALIWAVIRLFDLNSAYAVTDAVNWLQSHPELWEWAERSDGEFVWHGDMVMRDE